MLSRDKKESSLFWKILVDILALICQVSGFFVWPILEMQKPETSGIHIWTIPFAVLLTSCGWWENYVDSKSKICELKVMLQDNQLIYVYIYICIRRGCKVLYKKQ